MPALAKVHRNSAPHGAGPHDRRTVDRTRPNLLRNPLDFGSLAFREKHMTHRLGLNRRHRGNEDLRSHESSLRRTATAPPPLNTRCNHTARAGRERVSLSTS